MRTCADPECDGRVKGYGLCESHLGKWKRGTYQPDQEPIARKTHDLESRLARYVDATGICWLWNGARDRHGYGRTERTGAHRWVYEQLVGPIPKGLDLDHLCRVHECVNPDHLEPVTRQTNLLRGSRSAAAALRTTCRNGHDLTEPGATCQRNGRTRCRECERERGRRASARRTIAA